MSALKYIEINEIGQVPPFIFITIFQARINAVSSVYTDLYLLTATVYCGRIVTAGHISCPGKFFRKGRNSFLRQGFHMKYTDEQLKLIDNVISEQLRITETEEFIANNATPEFE